MLTKQPCAAVSSATGQTHTSATTLKIEEGNKRKPQKVKKKKKRISLFHESLLARFRDRKGGVRQVYATSGNVLYSCINTL